jgi:Peptidase family M28
MTRVRTGLMLALLTVAVGIAAPAPDGKRWWSFVEMLANDDMQGRNTGSPAHRKAADLIAAEFKRVGVAPGAAAGSYIQPVKFTGRKIVEAESSLELVRNGKAEKLTLGGLDLKGKIIVVMAGGPSTIPGNLRSHYSYPSERQKVLEQAGAVGLITIQNPRTDDVPWARSSLARLQEAMSLAEQDLVDYKSLKLGVTINAAHADTWLAGSGHTVTELLDLVSAGKPLPRFPLVPSLRARVKVERRDIESQNVVGIRPGSDPALKSEYIVLSSHLDHLGIAEPIDGDRIYNGAMDDASGVAALLEIASQLNEEKVTTRRSLVFVAVTGEEKGLLGSRYFAAHPTVDGKRMVADLNMDMFLPLYPFKVMTVYGLKESDHGDAIQKVAKPMNIEVQDDPAPERNIFVRSDQYNFIRHGVPSVMTDVGNKKGSKEEAIEKAWLEKRYHAPSDDLKQPVDLQAAGEYVRFMRQLAELVADAPARPEWRANSFFRRFQ